MKITTCSFRLPFISNGRLLEAGILVRNGQKMVIFRVQIRGWAFIRAWALVRDFTVSGKTKN